MIKKIFLITISLFFGLAVCAKNIKVMSLDEFSTAEPSKIFRVQVLEPFYENSIQLDEGTVIEGRVVKIEPPKRAKRNAYFEIEPVSYVYQGKKYVLQSSQFRAKVVDFKPIDPAKLAYSTAKKAIGFIVKNSSYGISFVEGVAKSDGDNVLKDGLINVYKDSPLSYIEQGEDFFIEPGDILFLKLKNNK